MSVSSVRINEETGMYTFVFVQAICRAPCLSVLYGADLLKRSFLGRLCRRGSKGFYSIALIVLWISVIVDFFCDWILERTGFVVENSSLVAIFSALEGSDNYTTLSVIASVLGMFISDAILVRLSISICTTSLSICRYGAAIYYGIANMS